MKGCALGMEVIYEAGAEDKVIGMINMSKLVLLSARRSQIYLEQNSIWNG